VRIGIDCHTIGSRSGGNENYTANLVRALLQIDQRNEYRLYVTHPSPDLPVLARAPNVTIVPLPVHAPVVRIPFAMPAELYRHPVDVLHVQYISPPFGRTPVVNMVHDLGHFYAPQFFPRLEVWRQRLLLPRSIRRAARVLTGSVYWRDAIMEAFGVPPDRIGVTYPGVSDDFHRVGGKELTDVLARHEIVGPYLVCVGNIQPRKNLRGVLDALALLKRDEGIPHRLVIVGRAAWLYKDVFTRVHELGLEDDVRFTSYVPYADLPALYSGADALVYPSFFEGFGSPPVEAMACGTPVVVSTRPAFPEILGDAAVMVEPAEPEDIARGIRQILRDPAFRDGLIARGYERARRYRWEETARQTLAVFGEVAS